MAPAELLLFPKVCTLRLRHKLELLCRSEAVLACCAAAETTQLEHTAAANDVRGSLAARPVLSQLLGNTTVSIPEAIQPQLTPPSATDSAPPTRPQQNAMAMQPQHHLRQQPAVQTAHEHASTHTNVFIAQDLTRRNDNAWLGVSSHAQPYSASTAPRLYNQHQQAEAPAACPGSLSGPNHPKHSNFPQHSRLMHHQPHQGHAKQPHTLPSNDFRHALGVQSGQSGSAGSNHHVTGSCNRLAFQEIQHRARHFAKQMHLLPPLAPRHSRCALTCVLTHSPLSSRMCLWRLKTTMQTTNTFATSATFKASILNHCCWIAFQTFSKMTTPACNADCWPFCVANICVSIHSCALCQHMISCCPQSCICGMHSKQYHAKHMSHNSTNNEIGTEGTIVLLASYESRD